MSISRPYPRLVKELAVVLLIKLAILLTIKAVWFDAPTVPDNGTEKVSDYLFGGSRAAAEPQPDEEHAR